MNLKKLADSRKIKDGFVKKDTLLFGSEEEVIDYLEKEYDKIYDKFGNGDDWSADWEKIALYTLDLVKEVEENGYLSDYIAKAIDEDSFGKQNNYYYMVLAMAIWGYGDGAEKRTIEDIKNGVGEGDGVVGEIFRDFMYAEGLL